MRLRGKNIEEAEVSTESLNDIMFFLLLFFLIISTLANPNVIKLVLPKNAVTEAAPPKPMVLSMSKDRMLSLNGKPVMQGNLEHELKAATQGMATPTVLLNFDKSLSLQDLVDVMQVGVKVQVKMVLGADRGTS